jgi:hypothetical protein
MFEWAVLGMGIIIFAYLKLADLFGKEGDGMLILRLACMMLVLWMLPFFAGTLGVYAMCSEITGCSASYHLFYFVLGVPLGGFALLLTVALASFAAMKLAQFKEVMKGEGGVSKGL